MHDNIKSKNEINENFTEWKTMLKCVNPSYAAAAALCFHCLLQHFPHAHTLAGARTHTDAHVRNTFARGWHFFPFSSVDLLVSMVSRIAHRKNVRRSVFFGCGKPGGIYAWVEIDFISRIAAIRRICRSTCQQNLHFCHRSVCAGVCSLSQSLLWFTICILLLVRSLCCVRCCVESIFASFDDPHNGLDVLIFHRHFEQGHHFGRKFSHWKWCQSLISHLFDKRFEWHLPRKRIDDFSTELTASKLFCISTKFCFRIWNELAKSSLSLSKFA